VLISVFFYSAILFATSKTVSFKEKSIKIIGLLLFVAGILIVFEPVDILPPPLPPPEVPPFLLFWFAVLTLFDHYKQNEDILSIIVINGLIKPSYTVLIVSVTDFTIIEPKSLPV
jgi:hypothetical protein